MYKMAISSKIKSHSGVINYFKELRFYDKPTERPIKRLKNATKCNKNRSSF